MASQLTGIAGQAAAAYFGGGAGMAAGAMGSTGGGTQGGNGGGNGMNGGIGGGAGAGGLFGGALDFSQRSSVDTTTMGGGGFDGSGWSVNIGQGQQSSTSTPTSNQDMGISRVAYTADSNGLPQSFAATPYLGTAVKSGSASMLPLLLVGGAFVVILIMKRKHA